MWPTQDCPEHQAVPQDGAEHDEAEGHGPHGVRQFALGIVYKGIINRKQVSPRNDTNFSFKMFSFFFFFPLFIKWIYATLQVKCLGTNNWNLIKIKFVKKWLLQETNAIVFQKDIYIFVSQVCTSKNNLEFKTKFFLWLGKIWFEWVIQQRTASNLTYQVCCYLQIFLSTLPIMEPTRLTSD